MNVVPGKTPKKSLPATSARMPEEKNGLPIVPEAAVLPDIAVDENLVKSRILTLHGIQMMLSSDLAALYDVEVKHLHRQVKRNQTRFPPDFVVHLSPDELKGLRCQNATSNRGGDRYGLLAFTEQGVAMLSSVLKSERAAIVNVSIMRAFVSMRRALSSLGAVMARVEAMEHRQSENEARQLTLQSRNEENQARNEERFDTIFKAMDGGDFPPQKVFFDGKHYDAFSFARKLVRKAAKTIILVDAYCDDTTLDILSQKRGSAAVTIATTQKSADKHLTPAAIAKFNQQNPPLAVKISAAFHDRFLVLDGEELYHFGASLKDLGRKYCAVTRMDPVFIPSILQRI